MCTALTFIHSHCGCTSYDLQVCAKLPRRCPSCPPPGKSKYIIQPNGVRPFIPESLSSCPSYTQNLTEIHPLPCQHHLKNSSPKTRRRAILESPWSPSSSDATSDSDSEDISIDAGRKTRNPNRCLRTHKLIEMFPLKSAEEEVESEPFSVGLSERYSHGEWRERTVAEILEDGRAEEGCEFKKERVEPGKLDGLRPWYSPGRWVWGKYSM